MLHKANVKRRIENGGLFLAADALPRSFLKHFFAFGRKRFGINLKLGQQINQRIDAAFERQEFIKHHHLSFFQNTKATLKVAALEAYDVAGFFNQLFKFVERGLRVFHRGAKVSRIWRIGKRIAAIWGFEKAVFARLCVFLVEGPNRVD
jgi:hypothetical protein